MGVFGVRIGTCSNLSRMLRSVISVFLVSYSHLEVPSNTTVGYALFPFLLRSKCFQISVFFLLSYLDMPFQF